MQKRVLTFILMTVVMTIKAQVAETAFAAVRYTFLYVSDTTKPAESENMILYLGKHGSAYKNYDRILRDSLLKEQFQNAANSGGSITLTNPRIKVGSAASYFKDFTSEKLQRIEPLIKNYLIEEDMPVIKWTVTQETKKISELPCQKATTTFRGRNYIAWFCSKLPYSNGPWKLGGLPGLIVEAADDKNQVVFHFAGYEDVSGRNIDLSVPPAAIKATETEFRKLKEVSEKDPQGFMRGGMAGSNSNFTANGSPVTSTNPRKKVINNPIELN